MRNIGSPLLVAAAVVCLALSVPAYAQSARCDIPREARDIWRCENGFVIGPENVIIRLPIPETDPEALYNAGVEAANRQDWRVAVAYFSAAHELAPLVPRYMYNLGLAHARAGHDIAAIASLAQYLIAEPSAPNRQAIWVQIRQLESAAEHNTVTLWASARTAVSAMPDVYAAQQITTARVHSLQIVQIASASSGLIDQASQGLESAYQFSPAYLQRASLNASTDDGDAEAVRAIIPRLIEPNPALAGFVDMAAADRIDDYASVINIGAWDGLAHGLVPTAFTQQNAQPNLQSTDPLSRAYANSVAGSLGVSLDALESASSAEAHARETAAATIGARALLRNDLPAARRAALLADTYSEAFARQGAQCIANFPTYCDFDINFGEYGWNSVFLRACILAEQGNLTQALDTLDVFASSRLGSLNWPETARLYSGAVGFQDTMPSETFAPEQRWRQARRSARYSLAIFLALRGRWDESQSLVAALSPNLQVQFYRTLKNATYGSWSPVPNVTFADLDRLQTEILRTLEGSGEAGSRRHAIEQLEYFRLGPGSEGLRGVAYDPAWWLAHATHEPNPVRQVADLSGAAEGMIRSLRRIHMAYQRAGGTWGQ